MYLLLLLGFHIFYSVKFSFIYIVPVHNNSCEKPTILERYQKYYTIMLSKCLSKAGKKSSLWTGRNLQSNAREGAVICHNWSGVKRERRERQDFCTWNVTLLLEKEPIRHNWDHLSAQALEPVSWRGVVLCSTLGNWKEWPVVFYYSFLL